MLVPPLANPFFKKNREKFMPLGLISLAAVLLQNGISTKIYEPKIRFLTKEDYSKTAKDILKSKPPVIGFSTWCTSYPGVLLLAREIKRLAPKTQLVFGGPQASILPQQTLQEFPFIDYILTGEADLTFPEFILALNCNESNLSQIPGLYFQQKNGEVSYNNNTSIVSNLDELPIPAYHLIPKQKAIKLDIGRGCPFKCTYCTTNNFFSKKFRMKSVDRILSEMLLLYGRYKVTEYEFTHDLFTLRKKEILTLCERLIELKKIKGIQFTWKCSARIDCIDREMIFKMKEAGCASIFFGIESGSDIIQKKIGKNLHLPKAETVADNCRTAGVDMHASYIIGFPEETKTDINMTLRNIMNLLFRGALVQSSVLALLPGTPLYDQHREKLKFDGNFSNFSQTICNNLERKLIQENPEIFSSFYYLPVKTMSRSTMVFLSTLINKLPQFINTFFICGEQMKRDLENTDLLKSYRQEYQRLKKQIAELPPILLLIEYLENYFSRKNLLTRFPHLKDVFYCEAYAAVLKKLYISWQLLDQKKTKSTISVTDTILPNPIYKVLKTRYKLEHVLPSENGWNVTSSRYRKGNYYYLLLATSEIRVDRIRISEKEKQLTEMLSELSVKKYVKEVNNIAGEEETVKWLKRLHNLGVVQIIHKNE